MRWVSLSTRYHLDPRLVAAGEAAEVLHLRATAYAGEAETSGFVPEGIPSRLVPRWRPRVASLVAAGLWREVPGGWRLDGWDEDQAVGERLRRRQQADRDWHRKNRARTGGRADSRDDSRADGRARNVVVLSSNNSVYKTRKPVDNFPIQAETRRSGAEYRETCRDDIVPTRAREVLHYTRRPPLPPLPEGDDSPHPNCRDCGTTPRAEHRAAAAILRLDDHRARIQAQLAARDTPQQQDPEVVAKAVAEARRALRLVVPGPRKAAEPRSEAAWCDGTPPPVSDAPRPV